MTEAQGTELLQYAEWLWLVVRLIMTCGFVMVGQLVYIAYKLGRNTPT